MSKRKLTQEHIKLICDSCQRIIDRCKRSGSELPNHHQLSIRVGVRSSPLKKYLKRYPLKI